MSTFTCGYCGQTQLVFDDSPALACCNDSNYYGCSGVYEDGNDQEDGCEDEGEGDFEGDGDEGDFEDEGEGDFEDEGDGDGDEEDGEEGYDEHDPDDAVDTANIQNGTRVRTATTFFDPCAQHIPGANNGSTAGRQIDGYDRNYNGW